MATPDEVYYSMCELAQKLIDKMDNELNILSEDQFKDIQRKINKIHKHMDESSRSFRN